MTQEATAPRAQAPKRDLDFILDLPLEVSAELGRTKLRFSFCKRLETLRAAGERLATLRV